MKPAYLLLVMAALAVTGFTAPVTQSDTALVQLLSPVEGSIEPGQTHTWKINAGAGAVLSFVLTATSDSLDPALAVQDSSGQPLNANDDAHYPDHTDAVLEAITIPQSGVYNLVVSGVGNTSGSYRLIVLPGFAQLSHREVFDENILWQSANDTLRTEIANGQLSLALDGIQASAVALRADGPSFTDFYVQVHITAITDRNGWQVGMTLRQQDDDNYYLLLLNNQGTWRFMASQDGVLRVIRDWSSHIAITPDARAFTLGVMAKGSLFDIFYDGQFVGQVRDLTFQNAGKIGLMVGTANVLNSQTIVQFDELVVTEPLLVNGSPLFPLQLTPGSPNSIVQELQRRGLIAPGGEMALTVGQSSAQSARPGISHYILGRGTKFTNFVMNTQVTWDAKAVGVTGCGLILRSSDETHYTLAYFDQTGGYGISRREGDTFLPGLFGQTGGWQGNILSLLIIAREETLFYYINGNYVGSVENAPVAGEVGSAVVNFEPVDTSCRFNNTWVWRLN